jgi:hypothetical protein
VVEVNIFGAKTVAAPAAAPTLSTFLLLIVPSVFFPTPCLLAFFLGIEISFQPFGVASTKKSFAFLSYDRDPKLPVLVQLFGKDDQFVWRGLC